MSKILRTIPDRNKIKIYSIKELRIIDKRKITINSLIDKLRVFEVSYYDNSHSTSYSAIALQASTSEDHTKEEEKLMMGSIKD